MGNDFVRFLMDMKNGQVAAQINRHFDEVVEGVLATGAQGELTVKVKVKPSRFAQGGAVLEIEAEHKCDAKIPELKPGRSIFFVTNEGRLTRSDPAQEEMFGGMESRNA